MADTVNSGHRPPRKLWAAFKRLVKKLGYSSSNNALIKIEEDATARQEVLGKSPKIKQKPEDQSPPSTKT